MKVLKVAGILRILEALYLFIVVKHKEQLTATNMYRLKLN
jgi:hypothetical protein